MELQEALKNFRAGPAILNGALQGVEEAELDVVPAPGKWTIRQIVRHLADTEMVAGMRLRQIIAEDRPTLIPFDQDAWANSPGYARADLNQALGTFAALRNDTAALLEATPAEAFSRVGVHPERGDKTLSEWVILFGQHVYKHANQIRAIREKASA